jgi:eukaryotic-like serine/threonine-protein kinase
MGEVFLAKKRAVGDVERLCIVKTLRGDLAEHAEYVRRFHDEARIVMQLNQSNICQVYESGRVKSDYFMAMEYIPGVNLKDLTTDVAATKEPMSPGLALYIGEQVCDALAYAHRLHSPVTGAHLRVVHRDVSPANVMVAFEGEVKLIDFGLAESALKTEQTETKLVMGKVAYMSPEQARGEEIDGTADQFAAGIVLYETLSGDRFYGDMNTHQVWQVVGHGGFRPRKWGEIDAEITAVLERALAAESAARFPSCEEFRAALEELRTRRFPRASRAGLRELMTRLYKDRLEAERDLIASFSDLHAPRVNAAGELDEPITLEDGGLSSGGSVGSGPWADAPSDLALPEPPSTVEEVPTTEGLRRPRPAPLVSKPAELPRAVLAEGAIADLGLPSSFPPQPAFPPPPLSGSAFSGGFPSVPSGQPSRAGNGGPAGARDDATDPQGAKAAQDGERPGESSGEASATEENAAPAHDEGFQEPARTDADPVPLFPPTPSPVRPVFLPFARGPEGTAALDAPSVELAGLRARRRRLVVAALVVVAALAGLAGLLSRGERAVEPVLGDAGVAGAASSPEGAPAVGGEAPGAAPDAGAPGAALVGLDPPVDEVAEMTLQQVIKVLQRCSIRGLQSCADRHLAHLERSKGAPPTEAEDGPLRDCVRSCRAVGVR